MRFITVIILLFLAFAANGQQIIDSSKLFKDINDYRKSKGLKRLKHEPSGQASTDEWAQHIVNDFNHAKGFWECIAQTDGAPDGLLEWWKQSKPHNRAILRKDLKRMTVAIYQDGFGRYWAVWRGY
jgi:uncharacterized protein YkwD